MRDHLFIGDIIDIIAEVSMSLITVFICGFGDLLFDHTEKESLICKDCPEFLNLSHEIVMLCKESVSLKSGKSSESHINDSLSLNIIESESGHQLFLGFCRSSTSSDDADYFIDKIKCFEKSLKYMISFFCLAEIESGTSCDYILLMLQIFLKNFKEIEYLGLIIYKSKHYDTEGILKLGVLVELIEDDIGIGILSELDNNSYTFSVTLVSYICDAIDLLKLDELGNLDLKICLVHHVRKFGDYYL